MIETTGSRREFMKATSLLLAGASSAGAAVEDRGPKSRVFGLTLENMATKEAMTDSLKSLGVPIRVRVVFQHDEDERDHQPFVQAIKEAAPDKISIMGCLADSTALGSYSVEAYRRRTKNFIKACGQWIDWWECGNEINGSWLGGDVAAKIQAAVDEVKAIKSTVVLTPYLSNPSPEQTQPDVCHADLAQEAAQVDPGADRLRSRELL